MYSIAQARPIAVLDIDESKPRSKTGGYERPAPSQPTAAVGVPPGDLPKADENNFARSYTADRINEDVFFNDVIQRTSE